MYARNTGTPYLVGVLPGLADCSLDLPSSAWLEISDGPRESNNFLRGSESDHAGDSGQEHWPGVAPSSAASARWNYWLPHPPPEAAWLAGHRHRLCTTGGVRRWCVLARPLEQVQEDSDGVLEAANPQEHVARPPH